MAVRAVIHTSESYSEQRPRPLTPEGCAREYLNSLDPFAVLAILHGAGEVNRAFEKYRIEAQSRDASALKVHNAVYDLGQEFYEFDESLRHVPSPEELTAQARARYDSVADSAQSADFEACVLETLRHIDDPALKEARIRVGREALLAAQDY